MLGVTAREILRCPHILGRGKRRKEIIVLRPKERPFAVNRRFADYPRLVNVEILEGIVQDAVGGFVSVVMAIRAARASLRNSAGEDLFAAGDLVGLSLIRELRQRVRQTA